ncbi:MAG: bifunctional folylpolyglutamate synthase/dihydrofolate synthase [Planctomycetota bacterium]|jgi:dihydrofolate synthase/folylpolyglutamate synthase
MDSATQRLTKLLAPLTNYERDRPDRPRFGLEGMRSLLEGFHPAQTRARLIQVGGSKGKGSCAYYMEALAGAAGLRTGLYLSPHMQSILERIRLGGENATEEEMRSAIEVVLQHAEDRQLKLSFFEVMCATALVCFQKADLDCAVLEVGLGGRLDATTAVEVEASILTGIEIEHAEILGDSIRAIAAEKSHVVRPAGLCFTSAEGEALAVFRERAVEVAADLRVMGEDFGLRDLREQDGRWLGELWAGEHERQTFSLAGAPEIELQALTLGWAMLRELFPDRQLDCTAMTRPSLPGRFEVFFDSSGRRIVLDGAHTERSLLHLGAELDRRYPGARRRLLFATAPGKRWREGLGSILRSADEVLVTGLSDTRSEDPVSICAQLAELGIPAREVEDAAAGLRDLQAGDGIAVVTGSFYLVGEVRDLLTR